MALTNATVQYVPRDPVPEIRRRSLSSGCILYPLLGCSAPIFLRVYASDTRREKCAVCGKWFLTADARHTKYCSGYAPNDKRGRTCRQVGNLRGREQRELAADHPIKKIYTKRFNTITQYLGRTLDEQTAAVMKKLAKSKLESVPFVRQSYAQGSYAAEMEQGL